MSKRQHPAWGILDTALATLFYLIISRLTHNPGAAATVVIVSYIATFVVHDDD